MPGRPRARSVWLERHGPGALVCVLEGFAPEPVPVSLVYPEQALLPLKARAFLDWVGPRLRARL